MARKKRKRGLRKEPFKLKLKRETVYSISSTLLFIVGGLIILSFAQKGSLLIFLNSALFGLFGWGAIFLPFLFISAGLMLTRLRWRLTKPNLAVGGFLIFISSIGLTKAGIVGHQIWEGLKALITGFGAAIILLGSVFIGLIVLFETSLEDVLIFIISFSKFIKENVSSLIKGKKLETLSLSQQKDVQIKGLGEKKEEEKGKEKEKKTAPAALGTQVVSNIPAAQEKIWQYPPLSLLTDAIGGKADRGDLKKNAAIIEKTLESFGIEARVAEVNCGPAVTQYALEITLGTKLSKITALSNDLALALAAPTGQIRIEAPIPGRSLIGVEVPNRSLELVTLKKMLTSEAMKKSKSKLTVGLGLDVSGEPVVDNIARMPHVLIAGATGSGKTCSKDTLVFTERGMLTFEETCPLPLNKEKNFKVKVASRDGIEETSKTYNNGICNFYKITTSEGLTIEVTAEHPLWTMKGNAISGWKQGDDIKIGDYLAIKRNCGLFGKKVDLSDFATKADSRTPKIKIPQKMTSDLGWFLGCLVADGGLTVHNRIVYTQANEQLLGLYQNLLEKLFGIKGKRLAKSGSSNKAKDITIQNKYLKDFLAFLGLDDKPSPQKEIPLSIRQAPREIVASFLQALIEHDAFIGNNVIDLTVASKKLISQTQLILLNFGIVSSLKKKKVKGYEQNNYYRLSIYGENLRKYVQEIGFTRKENYQKVAELIGLRHNPNKDLIPNLKNLLQDLKEKYRARFAQLTNNGWQYLPKVAVPKYAFSILKSYNVGMRMPSYQMLDRILDFYQLISEAPAYQELKTVREQNFYWSKVVRIEKTTGEGYDFEVPGSNSFVGNGFINHNSVAINSFIATILFRAAPTEVKLILVDPKRVELTQYNGIPHLLTPVIIDPEKVVSALKWAIGEMERRYKLFAGAGARNIGSYNEISGFQALPYIVIIVDELADIIFFAPSEVEDTITRIAQMARATGIHLIVSTQRPSVDVITGLIKANIPCRIAFNVSSMVDSRVIIDLPGAEKLLGRGDMLYIPPDQAKPSRIQGAFVSDAEIRKLIKFLKETGVSPHYTEEVTSKYKAKAISGYPGSVGVTDEFFDEAVRVVCQYDRASASLLQRRLSIGYARAARILDQLEAAGIVSPAEGSKPRDVLIQNADEFLARREE